jgi:hypothetical protein
MRTGLLPLLLYALACSFAANKPGSVNNSDLEERPLD